MGSCESRRFLFYRKSETRRITWACDWILYTRMKIKGSKWNSGSGRIEKCRTKGSGNGGPISYWCPRNHSSNKRIRE